MAWGATRQTPKTVYQSRAMSREALEIIMHNIHVTLKYSISNIERGILPIIAMSPVPGIKPLPPLAEEKRKSPANKRTTGPMPLDLSVRKPGRRVAALRHVTTGTCLPAAHSFAVALACLYLCFGRNWLLPLSARRTE